MFPCSDGKRKHNIRHCEGVPVTVVIHLLLQNIYYLHFDYSSFLPAFAASDADINFSRSPSSTPDELLVS